MMLDGNTMDVNDYVTISI